MQSLDLLQKHGYLSESGMAEKDSFCLQLWYLNAEIERQVDQTTDLDCDPNCTKINAWTATSRELNWDTIDKRIH